MGCTGSNPLFSLDTFLEWLQIRLTCESKTAVGQSLGVSHVAVDRWLTGERNPTKTVLILASLLAKRDVGEWPLG